MLVLLVDAIRPADAKSVPTRLSHEAVGGNTWSSLLFNRFFAAEREDRSPAKRLSPGPGGGLGRPGERR